MSTPVNIYFDESGFTGNNLLDSNQTIFSYASVRVENEEAHNFVNSIIKRYEINNNELKGSDLLGYKNNRGKKAISEILEHFQGRIKVSVSDKKYALATKFFEYIFEPPLQSNSHLFYRINFHRFVSNILYIGLVNREAGTEEIFEDFKRLIKTRTIENLESLFSTGGHSENLPSIFAQIKEFAILNKSTILEQLDGNPKWVLDLTSSSLFILLGQWGQEFEQLTIFCDESKPLTESQSVFNVMINRTDKKSYSPTGNDEIPITFNLSSPLQLVSSLVHPGIQIADCIAAAFAYMFKNVEDDEYAIEWKRKYIDLTNNVSIFPELEHVDLNRHAVQRNALVLYELLERSKRGVNLVEGMPEYISMISKALISDPIKLKK